MLADNLCTYLILDPREEFVEGGGQALGPPALGEPRQQVVNLRSEMTKGGTLKTSLPSPLPLPTHRLLPSWYLVRLLLGEV